MRLVQIHADDWKNFSEQAHGIVFNEIRPADMNRIDFALVVEGDDGKPLVYMTVRETDSETAYMQYGGAFPSAKGTINSFFGYMMMLRFLSERYKYGNTLIENDNSAMLKFAMKAGMKIIGLRNFNGSILLEHFIQWRT